MSLLNELKKQAGDAAETTGFKSSQAQQSSTGLIKSVHIPVEIPRDGGKLRIYLEVSPEAVESPETLNAVLDMIEQSYDLAVWKRQQGASSGFKSSYKRRW